MGKNYLWQTKLQHLKTIAVLDQTYIYSKMDSIIFDQTQPNQNQKLKIYDCKNKENKQVLQKNQWWQTTSQTFAVLDQPSIQPEMDSSISDQT